MIRDALEMTAEILEIEEHEVFVHAIKARYGNVRMVVPELAYQRYLDNDEMPMCVLIWCCKQLRRHYNERKGGGQ